MGTTKTKQKPRLSYADRAEIEERRIAMLRLMAQGHLLNRVCTLLSEQYGVKPRSIELDWERREKWMPELMQWEGRWVRIKMYDQIYRMDVVIADLYELVDTEKKKTRWRKDPESGEFEKVSASNIGTLAGLQDRIGRMICLQTEMAQNFGILPKRPEFFLIQADKVEVFVNALPALFREFVPPKRLAECDQAYRRLIPKPSSGIDSPA